MFKVLSSKVSKEVIMIARECMGGNGILMENKTIKMLMDV